MTHMLDILFNLTPPSPKRHTHTHTFTHARTHTQPSQSHTHINTKSQNMPTYLIPIPASTGLHKQKYRHTQAKGQRNQRKAPQKHAHTCEYCVQAGC